MNNFTEKEWCEDFKEFVSSSNTEVPEQLSKTILSYVHRSLHPRAWLVFVRLLVIHAVIGMFSLSICSQFGMNPFNTSFSLSDYFMSFGHSFCMAFCGFFFVGLSIGFAWIFLRPEELKVLRMNQWIQVPFLALLSLVTFLVFGASIVFSIGLLWFLGAITGGFLFTTLTTKRIIVT